ncbi:MAG: hypothetical protein ACE5EH_10735 [Gammaproteobacteria bacterium]
MLIPKRLSIIYCLVLLFLVIFPVYAAEQDIELTQAREIFLQGVDGDKRAVRQAVKRFTELSHRHPGDPVYLAYLGASMTLQGRDASKGSEKQRLTINGLGKIDRALKLLSDNEQIPVHRRLDTQLVAANSFMYIPSFFNRYERGKHLLRDILDHEGFEDMAAGFKAAAFFTAAIVARGNENNSEYRRYLKLTVETAPDGREGVFAKELLEEQ